MQCATIWGTENNFKSRGRPMILSIPSKTNGDLKITYATGRDVLWRRQTYCKIWNKLSLNWKFALFCPPLGFSLPRGRYRPLRETLFTPHFTNQDRKQFIHIKRFCFCSVMKTFVQSSRLFFSHEDFVFFITENPNWTDLHCVAKARSSWIQFLEIVAEKWF